MGLLTSLLLAPITLPLQGTLAVARRIQQLAEDTYYDPAAVKSELGRLEAALDRGEIDEAQYEAAEALLLQRLREIAARAAGLPSHDAETAAPAEPPDDAAIGEVAGATPP